MEMKKQAAKMLPASFLLSLVSVRATANSSQLALQSLDDSVIW
jgi:hypothetical protein